MKSIFIMKVLDIIIIITMTYSLIKLGAKYENVEIFEYFIKITSILSKISTRCTTTS